jgi:predicted TIM-barrel fold metal-dependent hydrolase
MIIDSHTHIFPSFFQEKKEEALAHEGAFRSLYGASHLRLVNREELLKVMDEEGVDRCVVFGFPWERTDYFKRHNDYIIESVQRCPERLIGFCCFSLLSPEAPAEARRCLQAGLSGVGELALYDSDISYETAPSIESLMETCSQFRVPILLHANEPVGHRYPGKTGMTLGGLYGLVKKYQGNRIILAHWGGGLFFYGMMKKEVKDVLKNVWFDTAASPFLYEPQIYKVAGDIVGFDKILFGTDYPLINARRYFKEMETAGLSEESIRKICGENAAELLGISAK